MSTTLTLRPIATAQLGSWTVVGAAAAHTALSDNSDSTYVQLVQKCRTVDQRLGVSFNPSPSIPATSQIYSVAIRRRIQTTSPGAPPPSCCHWHRCPNHGGLIGLIVTLIVDILRFFFGSRCPQPPPSNPIVQWVDEVLPAIPTDPTGGPWTLASFTSYVYEMGRDDTNNNPLRIAEVFLDIVYEQQSTITVTAPTGSITDTCRPTVTWTYSSPDSEPQAAFNVAVYTAAQVAAVGFVPFVTTPQQTSGWVLGEALAWTLNTDITNGGYSAYVQVQQAWSGTGTFLSGVASTSWTQSIAGAPIASFLSAVFDTAAKYITLSFQPGGSTPTTFGYRIETSEDLGMSWNPVRGGVLMAATGGVQTLIHNEALFNAVNQYRVLAYGKTGSILIPATGYSTVLSVTPVSNDFILGDPTNPFLNTVLPIGYVGDTVTRRRVQGTFEPVSASTFVQKIVVNGPQYGIEGTYELKFHINQPTDYWAAFRALDSSGRTLYIRYPTGEHFYLRFGPGAAGSDEQYTWDSTQNTKVKYRLVTVSYTEVDKPPITS